MEIVEVVLGLAGKQERFGAAAVGAGVLTRSSFAVWRTPAGGIAGIAIAAIARRNKFLRREIEVFVFGGEGIHCFPMRVWARVGAARGWNWSQAVDFAWGINFGCFEMAGVVVVGLGDGAFYETKWKWC